MAERKRLIEILHPHYGEVIHSDTPIRLFCLVPIEGSPEMIVRIRTRGNECVWQTRRPFADMFDVREFASACTPGIYSIQVVVPSVEAISQRQYVQFTRQAASVETCSSDERLRCELPWTRMILNSTRANPCNRLAKGIRNPYHHEADGYDPWNSPFMVGLRQALLEGDRKFCHEKCPRVQPGTVSLARIFHTGT